MSVKSSIWAGRFILAALIQGGIMFIITVILLAFNDAAFGYTSPGAVVANGAAGTWLLVGYLGYIIFPIIGTGLSALFYHYFEVMLNRPYKGFMSWLAWGHLLLGNIGIGLAFLLMIYGGYWGGAAMVPTYLGGLGENAYYAHTHYLSALAEPIAYLLAVGAVGPFLGGLGYLLEVLKGRGVLTT